MHDYLPFVFIGLATGAVYGMEAIGLVLTYKTSGIFNFAQGSTSSVGVFVFYFLNVQHHIPWPLTALIVLFVVGPLCGLLLERVGRFVEPCSDVLKVTAMIGIVLVVISIGNIWYPNQASFPVLLPSSTFRFLGAYVSWSDLITAGISLVCAAALYYFLTYRRTGVAMRGTVDDPQLLAYAGTSPVRVRRLAWVISAVFAVLAGLLIAPNQSVDGMTLTLLLIQAFGAAAVGFFQSLPLAYVGGLGLGVASSLVTKFSSSSTTLDTLPIAVPFLLLFVALYVAPKGKLSSRRFQRPRAFIPEWHAPWRMRIIFGVLAVGAFAAVPSFVGSNLPDYTVWLAYIILFLSLGLLIRNSAQVSLCQYGFAAIGAVTVAHLTTGFHVPWLLALLLSGLIVVPFGVLLAVPATRLPGVFLALITLAFGVLLEQVGYNYRFMFGAATGSVLATQPGLTIGPWNMGSPKGYYYLCLLITVMIAVVVTVLLGGRLGRLMSGLSESPLVLETSGTSVARLRVLTFCISSFMAGIAGALMASDFHNASEGTFPSFNSLTLAAIMVLILMGVPWYAVMAGASLAIIPAYLTFPQLTNYLNLIFGVSAVLAPLTIGRYNGAPEFNRRWIEGLDRLLFKRWAKQLREVGAEGPLLAAGDGKTDDAMLIRHPADQLAAETDGERRQGGLIVRDLSVRYGGVRAVDGVSLEAPAGRVTGLIGPNGAGKTSLFNACCGLVKIEGGEIVLHGENVTSLSSATRAQRGLGRTFQRPDILPNLNVSENISIGLEASLAGTNVVRQVFPGGAERARVDESVREAANVVGVTDLLDLKAGDLTAGQQRLVELARVIGAPVDIILLDEPSAGLSGREVENLVEILKRVVMDLGLGLLLVEHDMSMVRNVCDYLYVLDFGRLIFEGSVADTLESDAVKTAYLGVKAPNSSADVTLGPGLE
jgi:ABC-type branched-subunit amino acid transport system ATPase component/branched-subunit amino acid ABC-type transport system permease component